MTKRLAMNNRFAGGLRSSAGLYVVKSYFYVVRFPVLPEQAFHPSVFLANGEFCMSVDCWDVDIYGVVVAIEHIGSHSVCLLLGAVKIAYTSVF